MLFNNCKKRSGEGLPSRVVREDKNPQGYSPEMAWKRTRHLPLYAMDEEAERGVKRGCGFSVLTEMRTLELFLRSKLKERRF